MENRPIPTEELQKRRPIRRLMQNLAKLAFWLLTDLEIEGQENFPEKGPLLMIGNHFSFVDIPAFIRVAPYPIEFIGGAFTPNSPPIFRIIPRMYGIIPVYRGTGAQFGLKEAEKVLKNEGILAVFPEGGSHGRMLRPARPGPAFLAARTEARILPVGLINMDTVFEKLGKFRREKVKIRIGKPFGPFKSKNRGRDRQELEEIGQVMMQHIAALIPPDKHGYLSNDPGLRAQVT
ncbi:MAG: lysophospholipid acyltransferase family protein, partial [Anaerolineales bacterium]